MAEIDPAAPKRRAADVIGETLPDRYISHLVRGLTSDSPAADLEDVRQDALLGYCKAALRWNPDAGTSLKTFAWGATRGAAHDGLRRINHSRRKVRTTVQSLDRVDYTRAALRVQDTGTPVDAEAVDNDAVSGIMAEIALMPEPHQSAMLIRIQGGLTDRGVGEAMGISEGRASTLRVEGTEWLRFRLEHLGVMD